MSYAGQVFLPEAQSRSPAQGTWIQCGSVESPEKVRLVSWPDVSLGRSPLHFSSVIASYVPYRVITASGTGRKRASRSMAFRQISETAADRERERRSKNGDKLLREFDGVMTRLHEPGVRVEVDPFSGRQRLHLCVSETTFFAFRATQWREFGCSDRGADSYASRLLSTNLLLVDDHGRAILVQRAGTISHGGRFAGTVTGACEVVGREGISPDVDSNGLPDLMRTLRREALEELGISLEEPEAKLRAAGVIQVETNRDMRTFVLVATARYPGPVTGFRIKRGSTDDLEGTWELGEKAMVLDLPKAMATRESLFEFVAWLRGSTQIVAHGVGSLLLLVTMRLEKGLAPSELPAASLADLRDALAQEIHESPPQTPQCVSLQSLWEGEQGSAEEI